MNLIKKAQHTMPRLRLLRIERERTEVIDTSMLGNAMM